MRYGVDDRQLILLFVLQVKNVIVEITRKVMQRVRHHRVKIRLNSVGWFSVQNVAIRMLETQSMAISVINK